MPPLATLLENAVGSFALFILNNFINIFQGLLELFNDKFPTFLEVMTCSWYLNLLRLVIIKFFLIKIDINIQVKKNLQTLILILIQQLWYKLRESR